MTLDNSSTRTTHEGHLPPGFRPRPGPRPERSVWIGGPPADVAEDSATGKKTRILGLDIARGIALIGMIATHVLPASHTATGEPTLQWSLFAGNASALFALLAGISLALMTGGTRPHTGRHWARSATALIVRALLMFFVFGLAVNLLPVPVYNILPYYALLFLLAIPLTLLRPLQLLAASLVFAILGPLSIYLINATVSFSVISSPTFTDLVNDSWSVFFSFLAGGAFPLLTWMTFICLGLMLGRMGMDRLSVQIQLAASGALLMVASGLLSNLLLNTAGGWERIITANPGMTVEDAFDIGVYGTTEDTFQLAPTTLWWLAVTGPHTNTPLSIGYSAGAALLILGGALLLGRVWADALTPLMATGGMTLTLYTAHLIFITFVDTTSLPILWFVVQIGVALVFATAWKMSVGSGPCEGVVSRVSKGIAAVLVPLTGRPARKGRHHAAP